MKLFALFLFIMISNVYANNFYYEFGKKVELKPKATTKSFNTTAKDVEEYETTDGKFVKFKHEILVNCKENAYCEDDFSDLTLPNYKKIFDNIYLIKLDKNKDIFEYCQKLYEKEDITSAHPNYVRDVTRK